MSNYEKKYLKYKKKYIELKTNMNGGLIGQIEANKINSLKTEDEIPYIIQKYIKLITIPDTEVIRVGSSMFKIQPFFSDIDVMNIVHKKITSIQLVRFFIDNLKKIVMLTKDNDSLFFSDFKAGGLHWSFDQIMEEKYEELSLTDACFIKEVVKLDLIAPYNSHYIEISSFYILKSINEYINIEPDYFENFKKSLLKDIAEYQTIKVFKAVKRVWSLARITDDNKTLELLKDLIKSNISLLSQINADVETLILLIEHKSNYDIKFVINELDGFSEKLSTILDIELDFEKINLIIDNIKLLFQFKNTNELDQNIIGNLERLHDYLLKIINKETTDYLKSINYTFPVAAEINEHSNHEQNEILNSL